MTSVALQTARAGSKSIINKNISMVAGKPLFRHNLDAALQCKSVDHVFVSTDCSFIMKNSPSEIGIIERPSHLCLDDSSHHEAMRHGLAEIESQLNKEVDFFILLLGNSIINDHTKIDEAIKILKDNDCYDSVITVSKFNMFNPFRAFNIVDGELCNFMKNYSSVKSLNSNDKNAFGDFYYLNGEFQVMRRKSIVSESSPPFRWMGEKIYPMILENNMEIDAPWQLEYLRRIND
jgi:N-acylneuraminate cytidylyltransferase